MTSNEEGRGDSRRAARASPHLWLDADPSNDEDEDGEMLSPSRESSAAGASSALTISYSNRSRLIGCEYEEICSDRWLPVSPSSTAADEQGNERDHSQSTPSSVESPCTDDPSVQSTNRPNNSDRDDNGNKGGTSSVLRNKSEKGKKPDGVIARIYMRFWGKKNKQIKEALVKYLDHEMGPRRFTYKELVNATDNFNSTCRVGEGGFGVVFRGFLKDIQMDVAIKRISKSSLQGAREYVSEIMVLSQLRHKNLVPFVGWCQEGQELLLVYQYMPNRSLDFHLHSSQSSLHLDWKMRYNIVLGLANALLYLHEGWIQCVLHRDIKPSNVLLDSAFNARLTDFGLARLVSSDDDTITTNVAGTFGYLAPEYVITGKASKDSDIYSFGIVVLEIACGRRPVIHDTELDEERNLVEWVWNLKRVGLILEAADKRLAGHFDKKEMEGLLLAGLWCCYPDKASRPNIRQVITVLTFETQAPPLPLTMPVPIFSPITLYQANSFSGSISISQTFSDSSRGSFLLQESADDTPTVDTRSQNSTEITYRHPQSSTSEHKDNTTLARQIPADVEENCEYPICDSVETTAIIHEDQRISVEVALLQETFDIGISTNYTSMCPLQSYHVPIIKGLIASLCEILKSDPKFDEVMDSVRKFTSMLAMVGAPLDDWNSLVQCVLRAVKEIELLKFKMKEDEADPSAEILSFLLDEIDSRTKASEEDAKALANCHQQLNCAIQDHVSLTVKQTELQKQLIFLQKQIKDAIDTCFSVLNEVNIIEARRAWNETRLESLRAAAASATQKLELENGEHKKKISLISQSILSKISSFSFDV